MHRKTQPNIRLSRMGLKIEGSRVEPWTRQVLQELSSKGIEFRPHFWLGAEWFSPEGIPGVAIPFVLMRSDLLSRETRELGRPEGAIRSEFKSILRHEIGHAIETAFGLAEHPLRLRLFGSTQKRYPTRYSPNFQNPNFVDHLPFGYAQAHPDEDFAETFAVWLNPRSKWKSLYKNKPVAYAKLLAMDEIMTELKGKSPRLKNRRTLDPISKDTRSFDEYLLDKKRFLEKQNPKLDQLLLEIYEENERARKSNLSRLAKPKDSRGTHAATRQTLVSARNPKTLNFSSLSLVRYLSKGLDVSEGEVRLFLSTAQLRTKVLGMSLKLGGRGPYSRVIKRLKRAFEIYRKKELIVHL